MARKIVLNEADKESANQALSTEISSAIERFRVQLKERSNGVFNFSLNKTIDVGEVDETATLVFNELAWLKMFSLVDSFDKEIAWHGECVRDGEHRYLVKDIVVYPQQVTGVSVEMDEERYSQWIIENIEDERFRNLNMQGHSHVNMGVTPSSTDMEHQIGILKQVMKDGFYVFIICNKNRCINIDIYDMKDNIHYETADVEIKTRRNIGVLEFVDRTKDLVVDRPIKSTKVYRPVHLSKRSRDRVDEDQTSWESLYDDEENPYGPFGYSAYYGGRYQ